MFWYKGGLETKNCQLLLTTHFIVSTPLAAGVMWSGMTGAGPGSSSTSSHNPIPTLAPVFFSSPTCLMCSMLSPCQEVFSLSLQMKTFDLKLSSLLTESPHHILLGCDVELCLWHDLYHVLDTAFKIIQLWLDQCLTHSWVQQTQIAVVRVKPFSGRLFECSRPKAFLKEGT